MPIYVNIMTKRSSSQPILTGPLVAVVAYDGLCTFEFGVAYEVFGLPRPEFGKNWYQYLCCSADAGKLNAAGGLTISVTAGLRSLSKADLIIIPGWRGITAPVPPKLVKALRSAHQSGARIMSLCSGIAVLAAAGLLDGRSATTHWRYIDAIQSQYPQIHLMPDVLYVDEGDVLTAAGSAAGIDLCLYVVRKDYGSEIANSVARRLVVPPHRDGGQAQFIPRPIPRERNNTHMAPLIDWMRRHLNEPLTTTRLADRAGLSIRTFQRRFEEATGLAPGEWLVAERIRLAQDILEKNTETPLDDVVAACGFGSPETMRHHFRTRLGVSPTAFRQRFSVSPKI